METLEIPGNGNIANFAGYGLVDVVFVSGIASGRRGYARGCLARDLSGGNLYINTGDATSSNWLSVGGVAAAYLSTADPVTVQSAVFGSGSIAFSSPVSATVITTTGSVSVGGVIYSAQAAPTAETSTTQSYLAAKLATGIITSTQTGAVTATLDTGANMDLGFPSVAASYGFSWSLINLGSSSGAVTVTAATGHTIVGAAVVAIGTSGQFFTRRTATDTWITYRIS